MKFLFMIMIMFIIMTDIVGQDPTDQNESGKITYTMENAIFLQNNYFGQKLVTDIRKVQGSHYDNNFKIGLLDLYSGVLEEYKEDWLRPEYLSEDDISFILNGYNGIKNVISEVRQKILN